MLIEHKLKQLVGERIIVIFTVADSGIVLSKISISGILKGRPCKRNYNDYDLFAVKDIGKNAILYINPRQWVGDDRYMVTLEPIDVPIMNITFNALGFIQTGA